MKVFDPKNEIGSDGNNTYCRLMLSSDDDRRSLARSFFGETVLLSDWTPWEIVRAYTTPGNVIKPLGDRAGIDFKIDPMVLSRRAIDVLMPHICAFGQALPLHFEEAEYFLFNVTNVIDAVDIDASEVVRYPDGGLSRIVRYVFKPEVVRDQWIFKVPQQPKGFAFVTDRFVDLVKQHGLTGFGFKLLWADETSSAPAGVA